MARYFTIPIHWIQRRFYSTTIIPLPFNSIPAPKELPLIGTLWDVIRAGGVSQIHNYIDQRHHQLGPIFREKLGHVQAVWLADPALYQQVYQNEGACPRLMLPEPWLIFNRKHSYKRGLFFMQDEEWTHYRKILSRLLMKMATLQQHLESLNQVADRLVDQWDRVENGLITDLERDLYSYFVQGLMCATFGRTIGLDREIVDKYVPGIAHHIQNLFESSARLTLLPPSVAAKLQLNVWQSFEKSALGALKTANKLTKTCLEKLALEDDNNSIVSSLRQQNVDLVDIERIVVDLFLAAADTTSHTTQWLLYLLAQHPEIQEKAVKEINDVTDQKTSQQLAQIPTIKGSVKEALRLYPVATFLTRLMPHSCVIGGYEIPAQTMILMSIFTSGRDERYYRNAQQFMPDRWNRSTKSSDPFASLPFGHGKRACIGRRLAEVQMYILLNKVLPRFVLQGDNQVEMVMRLLGTVDQPVRLRLRPRL